ncbi:MAG: 4Fe-4S dicluster domain-containing protein [Candidatus Thermoplasmatota archaeon]
MVTVELDGTKFDVDEGMTVLDAARKHNIEIPTLCYNKALSPYGACRLCVVEILSARGAQLASACTYPVSEGLRVITNSEKVQKSRRLTLELLLARCPEEEVVINLAKEHGISETRFKKKDDNCIFCGLCVRMCERMGMQAINFTGRGMNRELGTPYMEPSDVCMTCGACAFICPTTRFTHAKAERISGNKPIPIPSEFNERMNARHAIYVPFPQAVPKIPVIDKERCVYYLTGNCKTCERFCEAGAILYDQEDEIKELDVGAIVVATGFDLYDPSQKPAYGYGKIKNVITGMEFERLVSASGPTEGHIEVNGKEPKKVVLIQCVGSRDKEGNEYCSRVCCMYTAKHAHLVREKIPGANVTIYYTDVRAFGKGFEEFYNRVKGEGVAYRRRELDDAIEVVEDDGRTIVKAQGHEDIEADLVVLATAIVPRTDAPEMARILNISQGADGFFLEAHPKLRPLDTATEGIFLAGCSQAPKDVPDTVAQASGAASRVCDIVSKRELEVEGIISHVDEKICSGCGICVAACPFDAIRLEERIVTAGEADALFDTVAKVARVSSAMCKGCGACAAACPSGAIDQHCFEAEQLMATLQSLLREAHP